MRRIKNCAKILSAEFVTFAHKTTIHGVPIITANNLHFIERLVWSVIISLACYTSIQISIQNLHRFYDNPTVVSIQKDYRNWFNPLPSATACFVKKWDEILADEFIEEKWGLNKTHSKYKYYREFVITVAGISYQTLHLLDKFAQDGDLTKIDLLEVAARVHPELNGNLVTSNTQQNIDWHLVITELGICFSVNTKIAKHFTYSVKDSNQIEVGNSHAEIDDYILHCHYLNGLCYARYDSDPLAPLKIYIHSYLDIAHATSDSPLHVEESQELEINFEMLQTVAHQNLRDLSPTQRRCRFDDEPQDNDIPAFSTSICYMQCRLKLALKLCGCRPFFYHNFGGKKCDLPGLSCIARYHAEIMKSPTELGCHCLQPCDFVKYIALTPKITVWEYGYFDQRLTFRWGLVPPTTKLKRAVIFGFDDLIAAIGGILALFLGFSFITAIEMVFFFIELLCVIIIPPRRDTSARDLLNPKPVKILKWNNLMSPKLENQVKQVAFRRHIPTNQLNRESVLIPYLD